METEVLKFNLNITVEIISPQEEPENIQAIHLLLIYKCQIGHTEQ